jgi:16S rRNA G966 N2-methylase RsmD
MTIALPSKTWFGKPITASATAIYDAACHMIEQAASVDEVKHILDRAEAMRAYARQARNKEIEVGAARIRERTERRLGEMLAAQRAAGLLNPGTRTLGGGKGAGGFILDPPADLATLKQFGINKAVAHRSRTAFTTRPDRRAAALAEHIRQIRGNGRVKSLASIQRDMEAKARRAEAQDRAVAAMPALITERFRVYHDDMATTDKIRPESLPIILTDLPYGRKGLVCYKHLARRALEWLMPGGFLIVMCGQAHLREELNALAKPGLKYRDQIIVLIKNGPKAQIRERRTYADYKPVLFYVKGKCDDLEWIPDVIVIESDERDKRLHPWGQSVRQFEEIVSLLTLPGQVILDPFCGGGTTGVAALRLGRQFIGIDIDQKAIAITAERLSKIKKQDGA